MVLGEEVLALGKVCRFARKEVTRFRATENFLQALRSPITKRQKKLAQIAVCVHVERPSTASKKQRTGVSLLAVRRPRLWRTKIRTQTAVSANSRRIGCRISALPSLCFARTRHTLSHSERQVQNSRRRARDGKARLRGMRPSGWSRPRMCTMCYEEMLAALTS